MTQPIFSSLGVNYSLQFSLLALFDLLQPGKDDRTELRNEIETTFGGSCALVYKGRDAIELALRALGVGAGDQVLTQAFACYAVEEGIVRSGAAPVYVDLERGNTYPGLAEFKRAYEAAPRAKAILLQHTLGISGPTQEIRDWCRWHSIMIIDDLAQALGGVDEDGDLLGLQSDAVVFSFGRDKVIDAVSGGAVLVREVSAVGRLQELTVGLPLPPLLAQIREALYPMTTWKIRSLYQYGIGKIIAAVAKRTGLLTSPLKSATSQPTQMPKAAVRRALRQWKVLDQQLIHRRKIAAYYLQCLVEFFPKSHLPSTESLERSACLRVPLQLPQVEAFLNIAQKNHIFLHDRWYRSAVDCSTLRCNSVYEKGSCPNAEHLSQEIINLPTHQYISKEEAKKICAVIQAFVEK